MPSSRSIIVLLTCALFCQARHLHGYKHEAINIQRRQAQPLAPVSSTSLVTVPATTDAPILTYITPSPGAAPVPITEESQLVTSYVPQFTLCELPPQAVFPVTPITTLTTMVSPWRNYSVSLPPGNGTCTTIYRPTQTMVCATTLTGLVTKYTVTNCAQDITFSTEYGFVMASPTVTPNTTNSAGSTAVITPKPAIQRLTTYYLAPWQAVTAGIVPDEVTLKVCALYANNTEECIHQYEVWHTSLITDIATRTTSVNISTTIHGLSQVIVETIVANITQALTTFRMETDIELEYQTEYLSTSRETATPTTAPTSYLTYTLLNATPSSTNRTTRTSTLRRTSTTTVYVGTFTSTLFNGALPTPTPSVDWVSHLGIPTAKQE